MKTAKQILCALMILLISSASVYADEPAAQEDTAGSENVVREETASEDAAESEGADVREEPASEKEISFCFDFGQTFETGWTRVSARDSYSESKGYGFSNTDSLSNGSASGQGILSDSVVWQDSSAAFNLDLPEGMYEIGVYAGDIKRMSIIAEGYYAIMNMTDNNCYASVEIPVTDGQLNLSAVTSTIPSQDTSYSISALIIKKLPNSDGRKKRVFIGGDSIAYSYYPLEVNPPLRQDYQGGWGQMLENYFPSELYVHNYATGGQTAIGFLNSGQFDAVEHFMEPGDYFIVSFGINDQSASNEEEFKNSMTEMVRRAQEKGGIPIIVTNHGRLDDFTDEGIFYSPYRWYKQTAKNICDEFGLGYIDLHDLAAAYFTEIGYDDTKSLYWINWANEQDPLHVDREGAGQLARLICEELNRLGFNDFYSDKLISYGISDDITLKCSGVLSEEDDPEADKTIYFQNLKPSEQTIDIIFCIYNKDGVLAGNRKETVTLPAFDVLNVTAAVPVNLSAYERAYLVKNGGMTDLNNTNIYYAYNTAHNTAETLLINNR